MGKISLRILLLAISGATCLSSFGQNAVDPADKKQTSEKTLTKSEVKRILADDRKIVTPNGIEETIAVPINGTKQWLSIRGRDKRNPILLFIHGGPGGTFMPTAWSIQSPWEDYFTVVQWDQRGAGKTYKANDPKALEQTMTIPQMTTDAVSVVAYLRKTYQKEKVFVVAHSWGTVLGVGVAQQHPDWLYAYVGVGQYVDSARNEMDGYAFALREAEQHGNAEAVKELKQIAPYPGDMNTLTFEKIGAERKWVAYYGGVAYGRNGLDFDEGISSLSPDYSEADFDAQGQGAGYSAEHLLKPLLQLNLTSVTQLSCPVFLFEGRHDYATSHLLAAEWLQKLHVPLKKLVWFDNSAHMVMEEESGRFFYDLVAYVRPLAGVNADPTSTEVGRQ